jgi:hypothetical protein
LTITRFCSNFPKKKIFKKGTNAKGRRRSGLCNVGEIRGFLHDFPKNLIFKTIQMQREGGGLVPKLSTGE